MASVKKTCYINASIDEELRPPKGGRSYFFVQNNSAADIYIEEGMIASANQGITLSAGQYYELSANLGQAVPQGNVWLKGSSAFPTLQRVQVKEG